MKTTASPLALRGGTPVISTPFGRYNPIGAEEEAAAVDVIRSGVLSRFIGSWSDDFYGGPKVRAFEEACQEYFGVEHVVTVNSWSSGLTAAVGAIGVEPGDEVIVTPFTMCATATAILHWNAIPVFADIDRRTFTLDPAAVERAISPHTRAIMSVDIFGQSADMEALRDIADRHNLKIISDTAQAPGSRTPDGYTGLKADIGGYSLNYHKHIHTGEGGVLVTDDARLAERLQLIRNHAEAVVGGKGVSDLNNMIGYNFRMGEIEAAIGMAQLAKLEGAVASRQRAADRLTAGIGVLAGVTTPFVRPGHTHVYYVYPLILDVDELGVTRDRIAEALIAEGVPGVAAGYTCVHLLPMYQEKRAYGSGHFPWVKGIQRRDVSYEKGICPVAEDLRERTFLGLEMCAVTYTDDEVDLVIEAFHKVWTNLDAL